MGSHCGAARGGDSLGAAATDTDGTEAPLQEDCDGLSGLVPSPPQGQAVATRVCPISGMSMDQGSCPFAKPGLRSQAPLPSAEADLASQLQLLSVKLDVDDLDDATRKRYLAAAESVRVRMEEIATSEVVPPPPLRKNDSSKKSRHCSRAGGDCDCSAAAAPPPARAPPPAAAPTAPPRSGGHHAAASRETRPEASPEDRERKKRQAKLKARLEAEKKKKQDFEENKDKYRQLVDDIMAGKFKKEGAAGTKGGSMLIKMPTPSDRKNTRDMILGQFRAQYAKIGKQNTCPSATAASMYKPSETQALQIQDGHRSMPRPEHVDLPRDFRKPVGTLSLNDLAEFGSDSDRMLVSIYGDIFDVSDRPDKYGQDGPYSWMAGRDLTWGFVSGRDTVEQVNKCYDLWKVAPESLRDAKLKLIFAWVAFYEFEYGKAVGRLDLYEREEGLKGPPMEESEDCCIM